MEKKGDEIVGNIYVQMFGLKDIILPNLLSVKDLPFCVFGFTKENNNKKELKIYRNCPDKYVKSAHGGKTWQLHKKTRKWYFKHHLLLLKRCSFINQSQIVPPTPDRDPSTILLGKGYSSENIMENKRIKLHSPIETSPVTNSSIDESNERKSKRSHSHKQSRSIDINNTNHSNYTSSNDSNNTSYISGSEFSFSATDGDMKSNHSNSGGSNVVMESGSENETIFIKSSDISGEEGKKEEGSFSVKGRNRKGKGGATDAQSIEQRKLRKSKKKKNANNDNLLKELGSDSNTVLLTSSYKLAKVPVGSTDGFSSASESEGHHIISRHSPITLHTTTNLLENKNRPQIHTPNADESDEKAALKYMEKIKVKELADRDFKYLKFEVWNKGFVTRFVGSIAFPLTILNDRKSLLGWFDIGLGEGNVTGKIKLSIDFIDKNTDYFITLLQDGKNSEALEYLNSPASVFYASLNVQGIYALHVAILKCDLVVIKKFFHLLRTSSYDHRDFMDFFQRKSLHYFCERDDCRVDILEYLLKKEADVNHADVNGVEPLHIACKKGHLPIVAKLLEQGADVNATTKKGRSPIVVAIHYGAHDILRLLLAQSPKTLNTSADKLKVIYPLSLACDNNDIESVEMLLEAGASTNLEFNVCDLSMIILSDDHSSTIRILADAVKHNNLDMVKLLLNPKYKVDINKHNGQAVQRCIYLGYYEMFLFLLDYNPDLKLVRHETPLQRAVYCGEEAIKFASQILPRCNPNIVTENIEVYIRKFKLLND